MTRYPQLEGCKESIEKLVNMMIDTYNAGGKVLICGNGGSCADSDHIVGELMKGFMLPRTVSDERIPEDIRKNLQGALPAISLSAHSAVLTAFMNDVEPAMVYAQMVYGYAKENDLFIGISTSGNSGNVVYAATVAKAMGIKTAALTGEKESKLSDLCDVTVKVPETQTFKIQELHLPVYHYICAAVEKHFFG